MSEQTEAALGEILVVDNKERTGAELHEYVAVWLNVDDVERCLIFTPREIEDAPEVVVELDLEQGESLLFNVGREYYYITRVLKGTDDILIKISKTSMTRALKRGINNTEDHTTLKRKSLFTRLFGG